jgi:hypothetical protein
VTLPDATALRDESATLKPEPVWLEGLGGERGRMMQVTNGLPLDQLIISFGH